MTSRIWAMIVLGAFLSVAGCERAADRLPSVDGPDEQVRVWPAPPLETRIRFLESIRQPEDMGFRPSFWQRLGRFIAGKEEEWLIRPTGVAARGPAIYVADPGAQAMWILDREAKRFLRIEKAGDRLLVSPVAVAIGRGDTVYLADSFLAKVFVLSRAGNLKGTIEDKALRRPAGLFYDAKRDRLYVADTAGHKVWVFNGTGKPLGVIGRRGTGNGEFNFPSHLTVGPKGTLYVTDSLGFRLQSFSPGGKYVGQFGKHGNSSGEFAMPKGVAVDSEGHIYVVEALFDAVQIFDRRGRYFLSFGERGIGRGQFWLPGGIFIDSFDRIYVADAYNQRIQIFQYLASGENG